MLTYKTLIINAEGMEPDSVKSHTPSFPCCKPHSTMDILDEMNELVKGIKLRAKTETLSPCKSKRKFKRHKKSSTSMIPSYSGQEVLSKIGKCYKIETTV